VVARCPDDLGEALSQIAQSPLDIAEDLPDVARDDQPVIV